MSVFFPIHCPDYLRSAEMTEVMMNTTSMDEIGLSPRKDGLSYQIGRRLLHRNGRCPSSPCDWGLVSGWLFKKNCLAVEAQDWYSRVLGSVPGLNTDFLSEHWQVT
ncbi:protein LBH isoform X9 [Pelodiscus sinensis]|uniref:protein LBH isoform X9 n=1 Tax=Pelodiscus sinensis TaxID=13735 RepID=UPI003F6AB6CF